MCGGCPTNHVRLPCKCGHAGAWGKGIDHCAIIGNLVGQIPLPEGFFTGCPTVSGNNAVALLLPDNVTLLQMQVRRPLACPRTRSHARVGATYARV